MYGSFSSDRWSISWITPPVSASQKGVGQVGGRVTLAVIARCVYELYCSLPPTFKDICLFLLQDRPMQTLEDHAHRMTTLADFVKPIRDLTVCDSMIWHTQPRTAHFWTTLFWAIGGWDRRARKFVVTLRDHNWLASSSDGRLLFSVS